MRQRHRREGAVVETRQLTARRSRAEPPAGVEQDHARRRRHLCARALTGITARKPEATHCPHGPSRRCPAPSRLSILPFRRNRSCSLSDSDYRPAGCPERSWAAWSGRRSWQAVTVFRRRSGRRQAFQAPAVPRLPPAHGRSGGSSHPGILWSRQCHTCPSAHPCAFSEPHQCITRTHYRAQGLTTWRTVHNLQAAGPSCANTPCCGLRWRSSGRGC
jgi:hypothetical protein